MSLAAVTARLSLQFTEARLRRTEDTVQRAALGRMAQAQRRDLRAALTTYPAPDYEECSCGQALCPDCRPARRPTVCDCGQSCCRVCEASA